MPDLKLNYFHTTKVSHILDTIISSGSILVVAKNNLLYFTYDDAVNKIAQ